MPYQIEEIKNKILHGDVLKILRQFPSDSIDMVITSPPYWLLRKNLPDNDPNKKYEIGLESSFEKYMDKMIEVMKELKRVLKPTGQLWVNLGDCYGGQPAGNKYISEANIGNDGLYVRKMKQTAGAKSFVSNFGYQGKPTKGYSGRARGQGPSSKCLLMMPERFAIRCIDELGFTLRNSVIWAKQVLFFNKDGSKYTKGSVMPTSVKDRFNQSYEYLFFFTKSKRYYSNLDAVRIPAQTFENRPMGIEREREWYPNAKRNKFAFNYCVRDAEKKTGQPQFKASKEEIEVYKQKTDKIKGGGANLNLPWNLTTGGKIYQRNWRQEEAEGYKMGSIDPHRAALRGGLKHYQGKFAGRENAEMLNSSRARAQRKSLEERMADTKNKDTKLSPVYNIKKLLSEVRLGIRSNTGMVQGKNIPTCWLINPEPHSFQKELGEEFTEHFSIFPQKLLEIPLLFGCPPNGIVLDPFAGSFTTALVAEKLGRNWIGIELSEAYCKLGQARIAKWRKENKGGLFNDLAEIVPPPIIKLKNEKCEGFV